MKRYDLELTATGPVMEERKEGAFVPFSEVDLLKHHINQYQEERSSTGMAISNAILSGIVPEQHPLRSRLELLANHHKREQALADGMVAMADRCKLLTDLLREARNPLITAMEASSEDASAETCELLELIDSALAGTPQAQPDADWTEATTPPTEQDYRELQAQHDQVQSRMKAALDFVRDSEPVLREAMDAFNWECGGVGEDEARALHNRIDALLADQLPSPTVTITETIRTAPERIWLQVGDQSHYHSEPFPSDTSEVSWCADSVIACEVPYVRADLAAPAVLQGGESCATEPPSSSPD